MSILPPPEGEAGLLECSSAFETVALPSLLLQSADADGCSLYGRLCHSCTLGKRCQTFRFFAGNMLL